MQQELVTTHYQLESLIRALILVLITKCISTVYELLLIFLHNLQANQDIGPCLSLAHNLVISSYTK